MKNYPIILLLCLLLILMPVFSFPSHSEWAGGQFDASGVSGVSASSLYPQNDLSLNFSLIPISDSSDYLPIVFYNMLTSEDVTQANRYFYLVSGNSINIYDSNDASLYATYTNNYYTTNKIICSPHFARVDYYNLHGYSMITVENTTSGFVIMNSIMTTTGTKSFTSLNRIIIPNNTISCDMYQPSIDGYYSILLSNGTINIYQINYNNISLYRTVDTGITISPYINYKYPDYSNPIIMIDVNDDGYDDLIYALPNVTTDATYSYGNIILGVYDVHNNHAILSTISKLEIQRFLTYQQQFKYLSVHVSAIKTGLTSSNYKIYVKTKQSYVHASADNNIDSNMVFSQSGTLLFNPTNYGNYDEGVNRSMSNIVFTDFNYDGFLEECFINSSNIFSCYNSAFNNLFSISGVSVSPFISMGKFTNNTYMSLISNATIRDFNTTSIWTVYNLSYNKFVYEMPVSLVSKSNYSNDIFAVYNTFIDMYQLKSYITVCGDNVCSPTENPLICPEDCYVPENNTVTALKITGEFCIDNNECDSGLCDTGKCILKIGNADCSSDSQCLSGSCLHDKCTSAGSSNSFKALINNLFGFSDSDGVTFYLLVAMVIFLISVGVSVYLVSFIPLIAGIVMDVILLVGFTFIGITPAWLLLLVVILLALISFILFIVFSRQS